MDYRDPAAIPGKVLARIRMWHQGIPIQNRPRSVDANRSGKNLPIPRGTAKADLADAIRWGLYEWKSKWPMDDLADAVATITEILIEESRAPRAKEPDWAYWRMVNRLAREGEKLLRAKPKRRHVRTRTAAWVDRAATNAPGRPIGRARPVQQGGIVYSSDSARKRALKPKRPAILDLFAYTGSAQIVSRGTRSGSMAQLAEIAFEQGAIK